MYKFLNKDDKIKVVNIKNGSTITGVIMEITHPFIRNTNVQFTKIKLLNEVDNKLSIVRSFSNKFIKVK